MNSVTVTYDQLACIIFLSIGLGVLWALYLSYGIYKAGMEDADSIWIQAAKDGGGVVNRDGVEYSVYQDHILDDYLDLDPAPPTLPETNHRRG